MAICPMQFLDIRSGMLALPASKSRECSALQCVTWLAGLYLCNGGVHSAQLRAPHRPLHVAALVGCARAHSLGWVCHAYAHWVGPAMRRADATFKFC